MNRRGRCDALAVFAAAGAMVMLGGTFAPWLRSGSVSRDSYRTAGLLQRLLGIDGVAGSALDALPLLAVVCALSGAAYAAGSARLGGIVLALVSVGTAVLAVAALAAPAGPSVRVDTVGPVITLTGSLIALLGAVGLTILWKAQEPVAPTNVRPAGESR